MEDMPIAFDLQGLLRHWPIQQPWQVQPTEVGVSNTSIFITTSSDAYVLRISQERSLEGIMYEHQVLTSLSQMKLPFAVPVPLPTLDGATWVPVTPPQVACLVRRLPGNRRQGKNLVQVRSAGEALGRLVHTLGHIPAPREQMRFPSYGDLHRFLPTAYSPQTAIATMRGLTDQTIHDLMTLVERVEANIPILYATLPRQLLHRDYFADNILMAGDKVSAVLDFEWAGEDVRALDFAIGLTWWAMDLDALDDWEVFEAFGRGYIHGGGPLTVAEAHALPMLALLRLVLGVTWSLGRFLNGVDATDNLYVFLCQRTLRFADWLTYNEEALVARAVQWVSDS